MFIKIYGMSLVVKLVIKRHILRKKTTGVSKHGLFHTILFYSMTGLFQQWSHGLSVWPIFKDLINLYSIVRIKNSGQVKILFFQTCEKNMYKIISVTFTTNFYSNLPL